MKTFYISILLALTTCSTLFAQAPPPPPPIQGQQQDQPQSGGAGVPIDGGASALLAAGAAYGWHKLRNRKKREN